MSSISTSTRLNVGGSQPATTVLFPSPVAIGRPARTAGTRGCILLVDHARAVSEMLTRAIRSFGFEVASALTGREALAVANRVRFDLLLLHGKLRDVPGLDVIRTLRGQGFDAPFIVMTGHETDHVASEARALGAVHVLEEPICLTQLRTAIARALDEAIEDRVVMRFADIRSKKDAPAQPSMIFEPHTASERWCNFVLTLVTAEYDLKTTAAWAKNAGVSCSGIREACRHVRIPPQSARDFGRILGAIHRSGPSWVPESVLDVVDRRTLRKFEVRSGFGHDRDARTPTVEEFLDRQQWIPQDNAALKVLRQLLLGGR